jgi:hypothetical protein
MFKRSEVPWMLYIPVIALLYARCEHKFISGSPLGIRETHLHVELEKALASLNLVRFALLQV